VAEEIRFVRRVTLKAKPDSVEEFLSSMKEEIYPQLNKERGIRRAYLLRDINKLNEYVSLTLWNSKSDADAYQSTGHFSANVNKIREHLEEDPGVSKFEVEYHAVNPAVPLPTAAGMKKKSKRARRAVKRRRS
jgi:quinol monooxygenase YgiN